MLEWQVASFNVAIHFTLEFLRVRYWHNIRPRTIGLCAPTVLLYVFVAPHAKTLWSK